jgi:manganese/iron transport system ATP-binding protein
MALIEEIRKTNYLIRHHHPHEYGAPILMVENLNVQYESGLALQNISFELKTGERLSVVGPNGAGKSTLFQVIAGVLKPSSGRVHVYGHAPDGHICIAYVTQRSQVDWSFPVRVIDVVMMGRTGKLGLFRFPTKIDYDLAWEALETVGLMDLAKRQISQLSGGQQQRMFIARALAQEAELMLMDEPLTGLDVNSMDDIFRIMDELHQRGVTILVAMHDLKQAAQQFDRVMLLNHKLIGLGSPDEVFSPDKLVEAYGAHLHLVETDEGVLALGDTCCDEGPILS